MEEGKTIIIQGIENEVDPIIDPVLEKQIIKKGKNYVIDVGGTQMDYNANFTLFMTCRQNLLDRLMSSTGNLLDDTELMDVLNMTKTQAKEVAVKLVDAEQKTKLINESRE